MAVSAVNLSFFDPDTELELVRLAVELGATSSGGPLSSAESELVGRAITAPVLSDDVIAGVVDSIRHGDDLLGDMLCQLRSAVRRRVTGAFFTPPSLVAPMVEWTTSRSPDRIVDAGCGTGRFTLASATASPGAEVVAVDVDPLMTLLARAAVSVLGLNNVRVTQSDFTRVQLPKISGRTAYIGNPPYVRHHDLPAATKEWARRTASALGYRVSSLAGLHALFYLAVAAAAEVRDIGCFVTSAEWLDVGYGAIVRDLLTQCLGMEGLHLLDADSNPFEDAMTTALIACFEIESRKDSVVAGSYASADQIGKLEFGETVPMDRLEREKRWSPVLRREKPFDEDQFVKLGDVARVHRGIVTGGNDFFVLSRHQAEGLGLLRFCRPAITRAKEIFDAAGSGVIRRGENTKLVVDIPADIDRSVFERVDAFLRRGEAALDGVRPVSEGYICGHRRPWWRLGIGSPPPIVASYMARQAPAFALNPDGLIPLNIAHGIYPLTPTSDDDLQRLVRNLNELRHLYRGAGRTYHGGMEKFEPRELEALPLYNSPRMDNESDRGC